MLATVLLLTAISQRFKSRHGVRVGLIAVMAVLLLCLPIYSHPHSAAGA